MKKARAVISTSVQMPKSLKYSRPRTRERSAAPAFRACPPGSFLALPSTLPASFPKATPEPVNVTAPMKTPRKTSTLRMALSAPVLCASTPAKPVRAPREASSIATTRPSSRSALKPMKTAARPTKECRAATSCGIWVISTLFATDQPIPEPTTSITAMTAWLPMPGPNTVAPTARPMPAMPYQTARFALSCPERPPRERMNRMAAARYTAEMIPKLIGASSRLLEHGKHPARDQEAANEVDGGDQYRHSREAHHQPVTGADLQQGSENHDAGDRIGDRHKRRMQRMTDVPDHLEAHEAGQGEDDEVGHEACRRIGSDQRDQQASQGEHSHLRPGLAPEGGRLLCPLLRG